MVEKVWMWSLKEPKSDDDMNRGEKDKEIGKEIGAQNK